MNSKVINWSVLILIIILGFTARILLFSQHSYISGEDGGYYAYQIKLLLETGSLGESIYTSNPVIFYTSALFALLFGVNTGVMIATAFFSVLLALSVYILMQYLFKNNIASLCAVFFVTFSPVALRLMADVRKNVAGLFFVPLILYFIFKSFEDKRYLIAVVLTGILGILSHQSVIIVGFVMLAYYVLQLVFKRKVDSQELVVLGILTVPVVFASIFLFSYVIDGLSWIASSAGMFQLSFQGLNWYLLPLIIAAVPGTLLCMKRQEKSHILLLAWVLVSFLFTLPAICGQNYWRFGLIFYLPLALATGLSCAWLYEKTKVVAIIFGVVVAGVVLAQFFYFGMTDFQMNSKLSDETMNALEESSIALPDDAFIFTSDQSHIAFWIKYTYTQNVIVTENSSEINSAISNGKNVYLVHVAQGPSQKSVGEEIFNTNGVTVYQLISEIEPIQSNPSPQGQQTEQYSWQRLSVISTYLVLPYELVYIINPPYIEVFQALLGLTLSIGLIGLLISFFVYFIKKVDKRIQYGLILIFMILVAIVYAIEPSFVWGSSNMQNQPAQQQMNQNMPSQNQQIQQPMQHGMNQTKPIQQSNTSIQQNSAHTQNTPCGDGVCDTAEQSNPDLCPEDC
ncbi:MAG: glycosyltransferase family 39 protein [Candidatus Woesearchaeota archaeon]|jgi:hypothetical protein